MKSSISVEDPKTLLIEIVTITNIPYKLKVTNLEFPTGFELKSLVTTSCSVVGTTQYKCRHSSLMQENGATSGTGKYAMIFSGEADVGSGCQNGAVKRVDFSLQTSDWSKEIDVDCKTYSLNINSFTNSEPIVTAGDPSIGSLYRMQFDVTTMTPKWTDPVHPSPTQYKPYKVRVDSLVFPEGFIENPSLITLGCTEVLEEWRCVHRVVLNSRDAASGTGEYTMDFVAEPAGWCEGGHHRSINFLLSTAPFNQ